MLFKIKHSIKRNGGFYVENIIRQVIVEIVHLLLCRLVGDFEFLCWEWTSSPSAQKEILRLIDFFSKIQDLMLSDISIMSSSCRVALC